MSVEEAARGVLAIAAAGMASAIREITVERGVDPRRCRLMPFGGAGPMFATLLARELDIHECVVPQFAGNFSAWGLLGADLVQTAAQTRITQVNEGVIEHGNGVLDGLFARLRERTHDSGTASMEVALDMRYQGQEHTLTVPVPTNGGRLSGNADSILERFTRDYMRTFDHLMDESVEIVSYRATVRTPLPRRRFDRRGPQQASRTSAAAIRAWSFTQEAWLEFPIRDRATLVGVLDGPAIVVEETATTYLDAGFEARIHQSGTLLLTDKEME
jgi:N-methylhydantoinase A